MTRNIQKRESLRNALVRLGAALFWVSTCAISFWLMSWQDLGRSIRGKWSGHGIQIISLQEDNYLSVECCWTQKDIIHSDLGKKQKQKMCSCAFEATSQKLLHVTEVSATMTPPPNSTASFGASAPLSNSLVFWLSLLSIWDWHRWGFVWEQWYGGWVLACCQLFWWLQIASALVGWSRHQQAEELSKELS